MRVLITEDDQTARRVLELFLTPYGRVTTVANGRDAIKQFVEGYENGDPYSLICLDIGLPDQLGLDVLRQLRTLEPSGDSSRRVPIIMLTGAADVKNTLAAHELGATKYLLKPVIEEELLEHLRHLDLIE
jgi:two-component system, chemotaxis family, chemotaxis protein CheY